jgi:hypothetical protein
MKKSFSDDKLDKDRVQKHVKFANGDSDSDEGEDLSNRKPLLSKSVIHKINNRIFSKFQPNVTEI